MQFRYFTAAGRSLEAARALLAQAKEAGRAADAFAKSHGAAKVFGRGKIECVEFYGPLPEGWRYGKERRAYPLKKSPRGKVIAAEMAALPRFPTGDDMDKAFGSSPVLGDHEAGFAIYHAGIHQLGDQVIITIPVASPDQDVTAPEDATPLPEVNYLHLKVEAAEQGKRHV